MRRSGSLARNAEVIRQWQILREIESRRTGVTIHELARLTSVSTRTIRRDLQALQEAGFSVFDEGEENETKKWRLGGLRVPFRGRGPDGGRRRGALPQPGDGRRPVGMAAGR